MLSGLLLRVRPSLASSRILSKCLCTSTARTSAASEGLPPGVKKPTQQEISDWVKKETGDHWVGYGMDAFDAKADAFHFHVVLASFAIVLVGFAVIVNYYPDFKADDWAHREAFLVLREREAAGLQPISRELVPPERLELPSDEELGDTEIII